MNDDREYTIRLLAEQVLNLSGREPQARHPPHELTDARVHVELRGMVHNLRKQIWIDHAAVAKAVGDKLEEAMSQESLEKIVAEEVAREVADIRRTIQQTIKKVITEQVSAEVRTQCGDFPQKLVAKLYRSMIDQFWSTKEGA